MTAVLDWTRLWCPREGGFSRADDGFLEDPTGEYGPKLCPNIRSTDSLSELPCVVLLGEAGIGKSFEIKRLQRLAEQSSAGKVLPVDLADYGSDVLLAEELFRSATYCEWVDGDHWLHLFLDGLDEALLEHPKIIGLLQRELARAKCARLLLRIACRTGAWPESLATVLRGCFQRNSTEPSKISDPENSKASPCLIVELLPLRESDVRAKAVDLKLDADGFLREVRSLGVGALAANPTTLNLLLNLYKEGGKLPTNRVDLYERGLLTLCERDVTRRARNSALPRTPGDLLQLGSRVAAAIILTGKTALHTGMEATATPTDLTESAVLKGGAVEAGVATPFDARDMRLLRSETGLFNSRGVDRLGFAHKTYGEFLAARYLHKHQLPKAQLRSLLFVDAVDGRLAPQLDETAGWLAAMQPALFNQLVETEPEVLLLSDVATADDAAKSLLTAGLLNRATTNDLSYQQLWALRPHLHRLRHAGLEEQLRKELKDGDVRIETRRLAIHIAEDARVTGLAGDLVALALNRTEVHTLKVAAARAVTRLDDANAIKQLIPFALGEAGDDPDDNLRGIALHALWPQQLSAEALFRGLTPPKQPRGSGVYYWFLKSNQIHDQVSDEDLPLALAWASRLPVTADGPRDSLTQLAGRLAWRAMSHLDRPDVLAGLCEVLIHRIRQDVGALVVPPAEQDEAGRAYDGRRFLEFADEQRRTLLTALVPRMASTGTSADMLVLRDSLVRREDVPWLFDRANATSAAESLVWARLAYWTWSPYDPKCLELWLHFKLICPAIARELQFPLWVELRSELAEKLKREHKASEDHRRWAEGRRHASRAPDILAALAAQVEAYLDRCFAGEPEFFAPLTEALQWSDEGTLAGMTASAMRDTPGWKRADEATQRRIIEAARRFLADAPIDAEHLGDESNRFLVAMAPAFAIELLIEEHPEVLERLSKARWEAISPFLLFAPLYGTPRMADIIRMAYVAAPETIRQHAMASIRRSTQESDVSHFRNLLAHCLDAAFGKELLEFLSGPDCPLELFECLSDWLVEAGVPGAVDFLIESLDANRAGGEQRRVIPAIAILLTRAHDPAWTVLTRCLEQQPDEVKAALGRITRGLGDQTSRFLSTMTEEQACTLTEWFFKHYSPAADPDHRGTSLVTIEDDIRRFRNAIVNTLAARGTAAACDALQRLCDSHPEFPWLRDMLLNANELHRRGSWLPPTPEVLFLMFEDAGRRYVASERELLGVVIESLERYQAKLIGTPPAVANLWDGSGDAPRRPKPEDHLSDNLKLHFDDDLVSRGIVANREIQIRRRLSNEGAAGEKPDLLLDVIALTERGRAPDHFQVSIEVKGSWNPKARSDMETQLAGRYLKNSRCRHGLYVVGWFQCPGWNDTNDRRRDQKNWASLEDASRALSEQAAALSPSLGQSAMIQAFVLDCRLPGTHIPGRAADGAPDRSPPEDSP